MNNEKEQNKIPAAQELSDAEVSHAVGGADDHTVSQPIIEFGNGRSCIAYQQYRWTGTDNNLKYLCPNCHRPVHYGAGWRYYCDSCDESWFFEENLEMNMSNGQWKFVRAYGYNDNGDSFGL